MLGYIKIAPIKGASRQEAIMNHKATKVTEDDFNNAYDGLLELIKLVLGTVIGRPRFKGFRLKSEVEVYKAQALGQYVSGNFAGALNQVHEAVNCIVNTERAYARNSVEKFFNPLIATLGKLDNDLNEAIGKKYSAFLEELRLMNSSRAYDMNKVSGAYWALLERIESAPKEQEARLVNREKKQKKVEQKLTASELAERKKEAEARDQRARQAQAESDSRKRADRERRAADLASKFEATVSA